MIKSTPCNYCLLFKAYELRGPFHAEEVYPEGLCIALLVSSVLPSFGKSGGIRLYLLFPFHRK